MQCKYSTCNVVHNNPTFSSQMWIFKLWSSQLWPCVVWETLPNFWRILYPLQGTGMSCQMSHNKAAKVTCSNDINYFVIIFEIPQKQMRYTLHIHVCLLIQSFYLTAWWWVECVVKLNMQLCGKGSEQLSFGNYVYLPIVIFYDYLVKQEHRPHHLFELQGFNVTCVCKRSPNHKDIHA